jgi:hypothetical protein
MICPCACAAMHHIEMDIDKINNVHPYYRLWYHPLWKEVLKGISLSDYNNLPFYCLPSSDCTTSNSMNPPNPPVSNSNQDDIIIRHNSEIFETIGNLGNISEAQQVAKMREHYKKLEKIAVKSVKSTKHAFVPLLNSLTDWDHYP